MSPDQIITIEKAGNPGAGDVYVNQLLPNVAVAYLQREGGIHDIFAPVPVNHQTGVYTVFDRADTMRVQTEPKAPGVAPAQVGFSVDTTPTYRCKVYGAEFSPTDEVVANWALPANLDVFSTEFLARACWLRRERTFASGFMTTGVWGTDVTPTTTWDDPSSDPIGDIETGIEAILLATGQRPNVLALGYQVWKALKKHPDILARIGTGSASNVDPRKVTPQLVAALFELEEIRVGSAVYNAAAAGGTINMSFAVGKVALLAYRTRTPSLLTASAGYRITWQGMTGSLDGIQIKRGRDERAGASWMQIRHSEDFKIVSTASGYFFNNCVS